MLVAIHQPNYLPWAGFFHKLARADVFVVLDDAQFPKNSYVNRVKIRTNGQASWLTIPAKPKLGTPISDVVCSQADWPARHLARLRNDYRKAPFFDEVWEILTDLYETLPGERLSESNSLSILRIAEALGCAPIVRYASQLPSKDSLRSDDRLIELVTLVDGTGYLSGKGGMNYQTPEKFAAAGIEFMMTDFSAEPYEQMGQSFEPGLSILDVAFNLGWKGAAAYVRTTA